MSIGLLGYYVYAKGFINTKTIVGNDQAHVAYPNDRAASIRPSYRRDQYK